MYSYRIALLGLPITVKSRNYTYARRALLRRYLTLLNVRRGRWPVVPTLVLLATDDARERSRLPSLRLGNGGIRPGENAH